MRNYIGIFFTVLLLISLAGAIPIVNASEDPVTIPDPENPVEEEDKDDLIDNINNPQMDVSIPEGLRVPGITESELESQTGEQPVNQECGVRVNPFTDPNDTDEQCQENAERPQDRVLVDKDLSLQSIDEATIEYTITNQSNEIKNIVVMPETIVDDDDRGSLNEDRIELPMTEVEGYSTYNSNTQTFFDNEYTFVSPPDVPFLAETNEEIVEENLEGEYTEDQIQQIQSASIPEEWFDRGHTTQQWIDSLRLSNIQLSPGDEINLTVNQPVPEQAQQINNLLEVESHIYVLNPSRSDITTSFSTGSSELITPDNLPPTQTSPSQDPDSSDPSQIIEGGFDILLDEVVSTTPSRFNANNDGEILIDRDIPPNNPTGKIEGVEFMNQDDAPSGGTLVEASDEGGFRFGTSFGGVPQAESHNLFINYGYQSAESSGSLQVRVKDQFGNEIDPSAPTRTLPGTVEDDVENPFREAQEDVTRIEPVEFELTEQETNWINRNFAAYIVIEDTDSGQSVMGIEDMYITSKDTIGVEPEEDGGGDDEDFETEDIEIEYTPGSAVDEFGDLSVRPRDELNFQFTITNNSDLAVERDIGVIVERPPSATGNIAEYTSSNTEVEFTADNELAGEVTSTFDIMGDGENFEVLSLPETVTVGANQSIDRVLQLQFFEHEFGHNEITFIDMTDNDPEEWEIIEDVDGQQTQSVYVFQPATFEVEIERFGDGEAQITDSWIVDHDINATINVTNKGDLAGQAVIESQQSDIVVDFAGQRINIGPTTQGGNVRNSTTSEETITINNELINSPVTVDIQEFDEEITQTGWPNEVLRPTEEGLHDLVVASSHPWLPEEEDIIDGEDPFTNSDLRQQQYEHGQNDYTNSGIASPRQVVDFCGLDRNSVVDFINSDLSIDYEEGNFDDYDPESERQQEISQFVDECDTVDRVPAIEIRNIQIEAMYNATQDNPINPEDRSSDTSIIEPSLDDESSGTGQVVTENEEPAFFASPYPYTQDHPTVGMMRDSISEAETNLWETDGIFDFDPDRSFSSDLAMEDQGAYELYREAVEDQAPVTVDEDRIEDTITGDLLERVAKSEAPEEWFNPENELQEGYVDFIERDITPHDPIEREEFIELMGLEKDTEQEELFDEENLNVLINQILEDEISGDDAAEQFLFGTVIPQNNVQTPIVNQGINELQEEYADRSSETIDELNYFGDVQEDNPAQYNTFFVDILIHNPTDAFEGVAYSELEINTIEEDVDVDQHNIGLGDTNIVGRGSTELQPNQTSLVRTPVMISNEAISEIQRDTDAETLTLNLTPNVVFEEPSGFQEDFITDRSDRGNFSVSLEIGSLSDVITRNFIPEENVELLDENEDWKVSNDEIDYGEYGLNRDEEQIELRDTTTWEQWGVEELLENDNQNVIQTQQVCLVDEEDEFIDSGDPLGGEQITTQTVLEQEECTVDWAEGNEEIHDTVEIREIIDVISHGSEDLTYADVTKLIDPIAPLDGGRDRTYSGPISNMAIRSNLATKKPIHRTRSDLAHSSLDHSGTHYEGEANGWIGETGYIPGSSDLHDITYEDNFAEPGVYRIYSQSWRTFGGEVSGLSNASLGFDNVTETTDTGAYLHREERENLSSAEFAFIDRFLSESTIPTVQQFISVANLYEGTVDEEELDDIEGIPGTLQGEDADDMEELLQRMSLNLVDFDEEIEIPDGVDRVHLSEREFSTRASRYSAVALPQPIPGESGWDRWDDTNTPPEEGLDEDFQAKHLGLKTISEFDDYPETFVDVIVYDRMQPNAGGVMWGGQFPSEHQVLDENEEVIDEERERADPRLSLFELEGGSNTPMDVYDATVHEEQITIHEGGTVHIDVGEMATQANVDNNDINNVISEGGTEDNSDLYNEGLGEEVGASFDNVGISKYELSIDGIEDEFNREYAASYDDPDVNDNWASHFEEIQDVYTVDESDKTKLAHRFHEPGEYEIELTVHGLEEATPPGEDALTDTTTKTVVVEEDDSEPTVTSFDFRTQIAESPVGGVIGGDTSTPGDIANVEEGDGEEFWAGIPEDKDEVLTSVESQMTVLDGEIGVECLGEGDELDNGETVEDHTEYCEWGWDVSESNYEFTEEEYFVTSGDNFDSETDFIEPEFISDSGDVHEQEVEIEFEAVDFAGNTESDTQTITAKVDTKAPDDIEFDIDFSSGEVESPNDGDIWAEFGEIKVEDSGSSDHDEGVGLHPEPFQYSIEGMDSSDWVSADSGTFDNEENSQITCESDETTAVEERTVTFDVRDWYGNYDNEEDEIEIVTDCEAPDAVAEISSTSHGGANDPSNTNTTDADHIVWDEFNTINLDGSDSEDHEDGIGIEEFEWNGGGETSSEESPSFNLDQTGTFTFDLTVTDYHDNEDTDTTDENVEVVRDDESPYIDQSDVNTDETINGTASQTENGFEVNYGSDTESRSVTIEDDGVGIDNGGALTSSITETVEVEEGGGSFSITIDEYCEGGTEDIGSQSSTFNDSVSDGHGNTLSDTFTLTVDYEVTWSGSPFDDVCDIEQ